MANFTVTYFETYSESYDVNGVNSLEEAEEKILNEIMEGKLKGPDQCCDSGFLTQEKNEIKRSKAPDKTYMNSSELSSLIFDSLSDGYDDEEYKNETKLDLYNELSQLSGKSVIRIALQRLCEKINELEQ